MASLTFEFPEKSEENRRIANVCEYCWGTSNFTTLAANRLKNGIIHLAIDHLEIAKQNGTRCTQQDTVRWWLALIDVACKPDCGCAQNLRSHVNWEEFALFWSQTKIEFAAGARLSRQQKKNLAKKAKAVKPEPEDDAAPAPAPTLSKKQLANERRKKKNKARKQAATALANDLGGLQEALPPIPPPVIPAALPVDPATGLQITFTATLASHVKVVLR